jgi:para-nitrobenzyl esterase
MTSDVATRQIDDLVEVTAPCGLITGVQSGAVRVFRGIPYGVAPVGELRFAPPVAPPFTDVVDALTFGPISPQDIDPLPEVLPGTENLFYAPGTSAGEDCLNLNIWSPVGAEDAPVLVYIHGGGFLCGSGSGPWIDGTSHARDHGLVVVTLNYRLGILGGLYLGMYEPARSNLGLQDQMLALRWVKKNISAFGGDPGAVTVAGQSAGAMSAASLLFAPGAVDLFSRAVIESGHLDGALSVEEASVTTGRVLAELKIPADAPDVLESLRDSSLLRILAVQRRLGIAARLFPLVDDGVVIAGIRSTAGMPGWAHEVDLLVGTTLEENRLFAITGWGSEPLSPELTVARLLDGPEDRAAAVELYTGDASPSDDPIELSHRIVTERAWTEPARRLALAHASSSARTYCYEFAWRSSALDGRVGAAHVVDIPFFFGNLDAPGVEDLLGERAHEQNTRALARKMSASLAQFVSTGKLDDGLLGAWPAFSQSRRATMVIDLESRVELDRSAARLDFWQQHPGSLTDLLDSARGGDA